MRTMTDWQKMDWLDRAAEPSYLGMKEWGLILAVVVAVIVTVVSAGWWLLRLF